MLITRKIGKTDSAYSKNILLPPPSTHVSHQPTNMSSVSNDTILAELMARASNAHSGSETSAIRHFITDYSAGRYNFNLPFQRKPQWKQSEKSAWIRAILKNILVDPLSISKRGNEKRGINGGNRARTTFDYAANRFSMDIVSNGKTYHYWFSEVPVELRESRNSRLHRTLDIDARERFLNKIISFNVRIDLTDQEEVEWYENMNKNQKSHTKGQLLVSQLCRDVYNPFVTATLNTFPVLKMRIQMPTSPADANSLGTYLAEKFDIDPTPMDERDEREDFAMVLANFTNLLSNGSPYNAGFTGVCNPDVLARNVNTLHEIFDGITFSDDMLTEFLGASSPKKQFIPRIWSPAYLLGPICWSIGTQKDGVVEVWRSFLNRCVPHTIASTYTDEINRENIGDESSKKYKIGWENVVRRHAE
jgi:hypothetical protein